MATTRAGSPLLVIDASRRERLSRGFTEQQLIAMRRAVPSAILLLFLLLAWVGQAQQQGRQGTSADLVRPAW